MVQYSINMNEEVGLERERDCKCLEKQLAKTAAAAACSESDRLRLEEMLLDQEIENAHLFNEKCGFQSDLVEKNSELEAALEENAKLKEMNGVHLEEKRLRHELDDAAKRDCESLEKKLAETAAAAANSEADHFRVQDQLVDQEIENAHLVNEKCGFQSELVEKDSKLEVALEEVAKLQKAFKEGNKRQEERLAELNNALEAANDRHVIGTANLESALESALKRALEKLEKQKTALKEVAGVSLENERLRLELEAVGCAAKSVRMGPAATKETEKKGKGGDGKSDEPIAEKENQLESEKLVDTPRGLGLSSREPSACNCKKAMLTEESSSEDDDKKKGDPVAKVAPVVSGHALLADAAATSQLAPEPPTMCQKTFLSCSARVALLAKPKRRPHAPKRKATAFFNAY